MFGLGPGILYNIDFWNKHSIKLNKEKIIFILFCQDLQYDYAMTIKRISKIKQYLHNIKYD